MTWRDTLFKRLFLLMWAALVVSHLCAFFVVTHYIEIPGSPGPGISGLPVLPSLPPGGPIPQTRHADTGSGGPPPDGAGGRRGGPPGGGPPWDAPDGPGAPGFDGPPGPGDPARAGGGDPGPGPGGGLPADALWLDYFVRFVIIGAAAWVGARWLAAPMRSLAAAAGALSDAVARRQPAPTLDDRRGTLEVRRTAEVFNTMARRLHEQFDAQGLLMAAISHDLRTPLARLRLRLEQMGADPRAERCVADVREMDQLIGGVLEMMRGQDTSLARERVDLLALAQSLADDLAELGHDVLVVGASEEGGDDGNDAITHAEPASDANAAAETSSAVVVMAQPAALGRVLGNLIGNAVRHGGSARVTVAAQAGAAHVWVDDRGPGISPDQLEAVFQPFYRVDPGRARAPGDEGGSGLGLYIARDLAARGGGTLTLSNRPEGGLRAELVMPLA